MKMTGSELFSAILIEGAIAGAVVALIAFLLSRFVSEIAGRTVLATVLFTAAGAYFGFAVMAPVSRVWLLIELLQCIAFGTLGLIGWRGFGEVVGTRMGAASGVGLRGTPSWSRPRDWTMDLRDCLYQL